MTSQSIIKSLREWVSANIKNCSIEKIGDETDLNEMKLMHSLVFVEFLFFCEKEYKVMLPPEEITPQNFRTFKSISILITNLILKNSSSCSV
ncbi:MAG: acyl carrier protein [Desulfobacterales bacterium]|nr:acyl carrier protein [Desulfobacterales bacterium]